MSWNIVPECISIVILCIIWVYSRKGNLIPNIKNRLFQASFIATFIGISSNILSTLLIYVLSPQNIFITWAVTIIYFVATPLMGMVYFFYAIANIYEGEPNIKRYFIFSGVPGLIYLACVVITPFNKCLFDISVENGYTQGPLIAFTYIIFYLYCAMCVILVLVKGGRVAFSIRMILFSFPLIAGLVIIIQQIYPSVILSGSAATCAMLIIYLYLQNKQISIDYLTHLPNRHELLKMLELCLRKKQSFSVLVLSLRSFKVINDTYGQHRGDAFLVALSQYLKKELHLRENEIFRYSGDEFALLLRNGSREQIENIVTRLLDRMAMPWSVTDCTCMLSAAIGIVNYPVSSDNIAGLINGIEYAVRLAKNDSDEFNVCFCTPELLEKFKRRHMVAEELEKSLAGSGFEIYYQPIFSVIKNKFIKAEALLRLNSERLGRIFPDEFIPISEETGLIIEITYLVLDKVCEFLQRAEKLGLDIESINVNFSALQFTQKDLIERIEEILKRHGTPYSKIKIELTESALAENAEATAAYLRKMNELGILIGLDDFGTGYSNFIKVLDLPIHTVKLDKSLVWSAVKNERCSIAVNNFTRAFRELDMTVLAEGVETQEHLKFVVDAGCTLIQGYLYAKPMCENDYVEFVKANSK